MAKPWEEYCCSDCGQQGGFGPECMVPFYLHDELWNSITDTRDVLCFDCTQKRLGRLVTLADLKDCAMTRCMLLGVRIAAQSERPGTT